jgi:hypothetical protein
MQYQLKTRGLALAFIFLPLVAGAAETRSLKAAMSWSGNGHVFQIDVNTREFLGALEGVLYIETSEGALDEAFMECSIKQKLYLEDGKTSAHGNCLIVQSGEDNVFAEFSCDGAIGACKGEFNLSGGTGRFEGITGRSELIIRSPLRQLVYNMTDVEDLVVDNGIALFPTFTYRLKGGTR